MAQLQLDEPNNSRAFVYHVLRYAPNPVRDEWVNIGVLLFDPQTGERRLRVIEEEEEYARVRRLHPQTDETVLRLLRDDLEDRLAHASEPFDRSSDMPAAGSNRADWLKLLSKWDDTLANLIEFAPQKGVYATDLDTEMERLYTERVALQRGATRIGAPGSRAQMRAYCDQVWKQARIWDLVQRRIRAEEFTFAGDPMHIDYAYQRNGTRVFAQTLSVSRAPGEVRSLAYTVEHIRSKLPSGAFTAVTDVQLAAENQRHRFVQEVLRDAAIESVPLDGFATWVAKQRPFVH